MISEILVTFDSYLCGSEWRVYVVQVCVIGNLCPETVEEAKALVPSIAVSPSCFLFQFGQWSPLNPSHYTVILLPLSFKYFRTCDMFGRKSFLKSLLVLLVYQYTSELM